MGHTVYVYSITNIAATTTKMSVSFKTKWVFLAGLAGVLSVTELVTSWTLWTFLAMVWFVMDGYYTLYLIYHTLGRDLRAANFMIRLLLLVKGAQWRNWTVGKMFSETAKKMPEKVMFYFEDQQWTFETVEMYSNRVANYFLSLGYSKGDAVALFMENRPEYVATWLGLAKIGVTPALINYNLKQQALIHTIEVAQCKAIIHGAELSSEVGDVKATLKKASHVFPCFSSGHSTQKSVVDVPAWSVDLDEALKSVSSKAVPKAVQDSIGFGDKLMYIYTSGTTGLPKAAVIKHSRYILAAGGCHTVIGCRDDDIIYSPLPLYHSVAGMISLAGTMHHGITMVMRRKFSATNYWADCIKYKVTAAQYIGEICRYLLNTKECPEEKEHHVRLMFGNGLRPQIWTAFTSRFNISNIAEFYGSTEGNSNIINYENRVGAVGFVSVLFPGLLPLGLIRINKETGSELRGTDGLCILCQPGEPGEFVGQIVKNHPVRDFAGYADKESTRKKVVKDVWKHGDICFRSGDILVMDEFGWLYFKDRSGDTFRWRGENVSTTEVEATVSNMVQLKDAVVYGVEIPGTEGRAGMAAIHDPEGVVDLGHLAKGIQEQLPAFARPLFVRLVKHLDITGTFKLRKFNLQKEGFDPSIVTDKLFFLHPKTGKYEALSVDLFKNIVTGVIRL